MSISCVQHSEPNLLEKENVRFPFSHGTMYGTPRDNTGALWVAITDDAFLSG